MEEKKPDDGQPKTAQPATVPIWAFKKALKETEDNLRKEFEGKLATEREKILAEAGKTGAAAAAGADADDTEKSITDLAEKHGMEVDAVRSLVGIATKIAEKNLAPKLQAADQISEEQKTAHDLALFDQDFNELTGLLTEEQKAHVNANKALIQEKAYSEEHLTSPLHRIVSDFLKESPAPAAKPAQATMEHQPTSPGIAPETEHDFENMTEEKLAELSPDIRDKYMDYVDQKHGSGKRVNR